MKNKISIYLNMIIICLSLCVISIGVYSLTSANLTISGSLGYVYHEKTITATIQDYSTTAGGTLQSKATNLTISEPTYNSTYGSNIITITLPNDIYFSGIGWEAPHIEILVKVKNTESTSKAVTLLFDDIVGLGYTRKVKSGAETDPESITTNHSEAIILSKDEQTTFRLTLKQSIRKTNLAVLQDELNIQLSVADYVASSLPTASTGTTTIDDITYTINDDQTGWSATSRSVSGDVTISPLIKGLPVNTINGLQMKYANICYTLTIPNSVTDIASGLTDEAFINCYLPGSLINICDMAFFDYGGGCLNELTNNNYVYNFETIGDRALYTYNYNSHVELELQSEDLKTIGSMAFYGWNRLTSITIPSGVTSIGYAAFGGCDSLIEVVNKSNLDIQAGSTDNGGVAQYAKGVITDIDQTKLTKNEVDGYYVYNESNTSKILLSFTGTQTEFTVPSDITAIHNYAFSQCNDLTKVTIPSSVTSIGSSAFVSCSKLATVTLNEGLETIGYNAFRDCDALTSITIPSSVTSIGNSAFYSCDKLATITLNNGLETIGNYAFYGCYALTSITIPSSVTSIGNSAFCSCGKLATVTLNNGLETIGKEAFYHCSALTSITIPSSVTSIASKIFESCNLLETIIVDSNNIIYDSRDNCNAIIETSSNTLISGCKDTIIPSTVTSIGEYAFYGCSSLTSITIPSSVTSIGSFAFCWCKKLETVTLNNGLATIGERAFGDCEALTSIIIPSSVTNIGDRAFYYCSILATVTLNTGLKTIGNSAFYSCTALTNITIPSSVTSIERYAFYYCYTLATVTFQGTTPPTIGSSIFSSCSALTAIKVPSSAVSTYKAVSNLSSYTDKITSA